MRGAGRQKRRDPWRGSAEQIAVGRAAIMKWNRIRHLQPKCGATRKRDGEPCQNLAMENGRCRFHGGKTGKGANWHKPVWPHRDAPDAETKLNKKLATLQRAASKRAKRVAAMTPEERAAYETWKRSHKPGPAATRARARRERQEVQQVREILSARPPAKAANADVAELDTLIAKKKAELDRLIDANSETDDKGAFG
ncbi:HGGxSTG domain-containing protein [Mesorhizobium sp. WSM3873]|uniref:HGGxSTG domain-containing protein n=1 Tax=Mesorhizobium sp. WSM3873 TaxID=1854056 RepID=UPI0007FE61E6|nr:HGGxSTG domain-containing protein [Mesorhizobium sp. WSM3873]OBQ77406.1 hypothetical protein A9K71_10285 [Mesorhizobium sp. WSM3873]